MKVVVINHIVINSEKGKNIIPYKVGVFEDFPSCCDFLLFDVAI